DGKVKDCYNFNQEVTAQRASGDAGMSVTCESKDGERDDVNDTERERCVEEDG
ncbi:hypothetical protein AMTR_s02568p00004490, partial [Amborella trichopoda]